MHHDQAEKAELTGTIPGRDREMLGSENPVRTFSLALLRACVLIVLLLWQDIQDNRITGRIPEELGLLNNLEHLWLQQNNLHGNDPLRSSAPRATCSLCASLAPRWLDWVLQIDARVRAGLWLGIA